jgi:UDP-N-acetylglucosamine 4,6-dehydratase
MTTAKKDSKQNQTVFFRRRAEQLIMIAVDMVLLPLALWVAFMLRLGEIVVPTLNQLWLYAAVIAVGIPVFVKMGLYRAVIQYMGTHTLLRIIYAVSLTVLIWGVVLLMVDHHGVPRSSIIIFWLLALLLVVSSRLWGRWYLGSKGRRRRRDSVPRAVIYGAGNAGVQLAAAMRYSEEITPVAFIDDNADLQGHMIAGLPVNSLDELDALIEKKGANQVLIAMPSVSHASRRNIIDRLAAFPVEVRALPGFDEMTLGKVKIEHIRDVGAEDLLGRDIVSPIPNLLEACIVDKAVMVTGAGGSIGSELCKQIIRHKPKKLILFELNEYALYRIEQELSKLIDLLGQRDSIKLVSILGSVIHRKRIEHVCMVFGIQTIYHAAAYKHVPLVEHNPIEAVQNNSIGTMHAAEAALAAGVETFVLISTDKAVRPTNVMGATKRLAEMILQGLQAFQPESERKRKTKTRFCMVRFGNVLGSSGSVIPLFREQIKYGGPVTVTHKEITRYFMTIPEAAQLVIQAGSMGKGGDVFVLDMGEPVRIMDFARKMILLSGLAIKDDTNPDGDIEIKITGLRPGEKLYEELLIGGNVTGTKHPLIMRANEEVMQWQELESLLRQINAASKAINVDEVIDLLRQAVREYQPQGGIQDRVWMESNVSSKVKILKVP